MEEKRLLASTPYEGLKNGTHIDTEVYYTKGGRDFFFGDFVTRGYYVSVLPVTRKDGMVIVSSGTAKTRLLMPAHRFSAKQFEQAVEMGKQSAPELISQVLKRERAA